MVNKRIKKDGKHDFFRGKKGREVDLGDRKDGGKMGGVGGKKLRSGCMV